MFLKILILLYKIKKILIRKFQNLTYEPKYFECVELINMDSLLKKVPNNNFILKNI